MDNWTQKRHPSLPGLPGLREPVDLLVRIANSGDRGEEREWINCYLSWGCSCPSARNSARVIILSLTSSSNPFAFPPSMSSNLYQRQERYSNLPIPPEPFHLCSVIHLARPDVVRYPIRVACAVLRCEDPRYGPTNLYNSML